MAGSVLAALSFLWFVLRVGQGLLLFETPDEMEHYVVAQMLNHGHRLYADVFSHHGPLPYMIAQFYTVTISSSDFSYSRISLVILAIISCMALISSPVLKSTLSRIWAGGIYLFLLASAWISQGIHTLNYWSISGFLFVIIAAQLVATLLMEEKPSRYGLFASGAAATLVSFCAYSNGPSVVLLTLSPLMILLFSPDRPLISVYAKWFVLGMFSTALGVAVWFLKFGDLLGFYVYHFYFNQEVYSRFIDFVPTVVFGNFSFSFSADRIIHSLALSSLIGSLYIFVMLQKKDMSRSDSLVRSLAIGLIAAGVVFTNPRAQLLLVDSSFVLVSFSLIAIAGALLLEKKLSNLSHRGMVHVMVLIVAVAFIVYQASAYAVTWTGISQKDMSNYRSEMKLEQNSIYDFVRRLTKKEGDLLVLNYNASIYTKANRLPASGNLFYLPWQAAYNRDPKYGYKIDICEDIEMRRPAVIWFFNWLVWNKYAFDEYEPCIFRLLTERYSSLNFDSPWHIRNDLVGSARSNVSLDTAVHFAMLPNDLEILRRSDVLSPYSPIELKMTTNHHKSTTALRRIGIMFSIYGRQNTGNVELRLKEPKGAEFFLRFNLSSLIENSYHYFDLDPRRYASGEIVSVGGGGISTWESHFGESHTCMIYEYVDGARRYTPACPIL